ncbi:MAG: HAD-IA family hydrolase [Planctomycetota bacterium]
MSAPSSSFAKGSVFLFDLDGTLADTLPDIAASTNYVRQRNGLAEVDVATVRSWIGDGARKLLQRALAEADASPEPADLDAAYECYCEHHDAHCTERSTLFPGVREFLDQLMEDGHPIAIVTNKPERFARPVARFLGLDRYTKVLVGGDTLPTRKPDPAMLQHALTLLGCSPELPPGNVHMVGDGLQDVRAGKAFGAHTTACLFGYGSPAALRQEGADEYWGAFAIRV